MTCTAPEQLAQLLLGWTGDLTLVLSEPGFDFRTKSFSQHQDVAHLVMLDAWCKSAQTITNQAALPAAVQHVVVFAAPVSPSWFDVVPAAVRLVVHSCANSSSVLTAWPRFLTRLTLYSATVTQLPEALGPPVPLQTLGMCGCSKLACLPTALDQLAGLTSLELRGCASLTSLPESIGQLKSLTKLDLRGCCGLVCLPESISLLSSLTALVCGSCAALTCLPESIGQLTLLTALFLPSCQALVCLPESMGQLGALQTLFLTSCRALTCLPESLGQLTQLATLEIGGCDSLLEADCQRARAIEAANKALSRLKQRVLVLVVISRRRDRRLMHRLPPELWPLVLAALWQSQPERAGLQRRGQLQV